MLHIEKEIDNDKIINLDESNACMSYETKIKLIAKATLDKRLNAKDMRVFSYLLNFAHEGLTQEQIADTIDMSRSNINKSIEKLTAFNYVDKVASKNWKDTTSYRIERYEKAGISRDMAPDIIRILNVIDKKKGLDRLNYVPLQDVIEYRKTLSELTEKYKSLKKYLNEEQSKEKADLKLIKGFKDNISEIEVDIKYIKEELEDTEYIESLDMKLRSVILSKTKLLCKDRVIDVITNINRRVALFLAYIDEIHVNEFREKYLEDYIKFLAKFTDDLNEDFFVLYYESLSNMEYTYEDIMKVAGVTHRDVPERKRRFQKNILDALEELKDDIDFMNDLNNTNNIEEEIFTDKTLDILSELSCKCLDKDIAKLPFTHSEFILIVLALNKEIACQSVTGVNFNKYIQIGSPELYECIMRYYRYKNEYLK